MPRLLQDFVTDQAKVRSDQIAVVWKDERIPYGELDSLTNQLAQQLLSLGCRRGDRVAVLVPNSPNAIFVMFGVLKADCVYVPIDAAASPARIAQVIKASHPKIIIAASSVAGLLDGLFADRDLTQHIVVGTLEAVPFLGEHFTTAFTGLHVLRQSSEPREYENSPSDTACVVVSAGSPDVAVEVALTHKQVGSMLKWGADQFPFSEFDRVSGFTPSDRMFSAFAMCLTFGAGAELHLLPTECLLAPHKLAEFIRMRELSQCLSIASVLSDLCEFDAVHDGDFPSLKRVIWFGEMIPATALNYLAQRLPLVQFANLNGPQTATLATQPLVAPRCPPAGTESTPVEPACDSETLLAPRSPALPVVVGSLIAK